MAKLNQALQILSELTLSKKTIITKCLYPKSNTSTDKNIFMLNARFGTGICCVECGSISIVKNGKRKDGTQKYVCKDCKHNFTPSSGTVISGSKKSLDTWIQFINCMLDDNTLQQSADKCGIHLNTAFLWRHKILEASRKENENILLDGKIEADETYFRTSYKGNHSKWSTSYTMPRKSYKRGHNSKTMTDKEHKNKCRSRGLSMDQVCVPCAITQDRLTVAKVCKLGAASSNGLLKVFENHIKKDSIIISDEYKAYKKFSKDIAVSLVQIDSNKSNKSFNIQQVDSLHSQMKRMFNHRFCGVATKYLNNYIEMVRINLLARASRESKLNIILRLIIGFVGCSRNTIYNMDNLPVLC